MRRWIVTILACLLLGAVVNVAVAWGIAYRHTWDATWPETVQSEEKSTDCFHRWAVQRASRPGVLRVMTGWCDGDITLMVNRLWEPADRPSPVELWPPWAAAAGPGCDRNGLTHRCSILATGWPSLSMWGGEEMSFGFFDPIESHENRAALVLGRQKPITASRAYGDIPDFLPLAPIWPGAIANTLLYAAAIAAVFVAPRSVRRAIWSRRNRCTRCGYPCGTSERCPECGQQR